MYHKDSMHNELVIEKFQIELIESLKKSLIFLLETSSTNSSLSSELLNIVFEFCIKIENSTSIYSNNNIGLTELNAVTNQVFTNFLVFLGGDVLNVDPINKMHINLLVNYVKFLTVNQ